MIYMCVYFFYEFIFFFFKKKKKIFFFFFKKKKNILMLSGIGPKNNLKENGIKVRKDLPIGHNLWDHPICFFTAKVSVPNSTSASRMYYWNSGFVLGIFHKGNTEGKIPSKEEFLDERPDMQLYGRLVEKSPKCY